MTLEFLSLISGERAMDGATTDGAGPAPPLAASPLEPWLAEAGARFEGRDGWRVAVDLGAPAEETDTCLIGVGIADRSAMGTLELQGRPAQLAETLEGLLDEGVPEAGETARLDGSALWRSSPDRALAVCDPAVASGLRAHLQQACERSGCGLVDLTAGTAAIELRGPLAREVLERLTAIDVRPGSLGAGGVRAGRVARVPATLLRTEPDAFLILVAAPEAVDAWTIILDAGLPLGVRPVGEDARALVAARPEREAARA